MEHKKLIIGVLVILLVAGVADVFASAPDASSAHSIVPTGPGGLLGTACLYVQASAGRGLPCVVRAHSRGIQQLAQEVPTWLQANSNGFGDQQTGEVSALEAFNGHLYAGTSNATAGARIFRSPDGVTWTPVTQPGFGNPHDTAPPAILDLSVFNGRLYASTGRGNAGQIWRTLDGVNWAPMVIAGFSDPDTVDITALAEYGGKLYAGATNLVSGAQIWSSFTGGNNSWTQVAPAVPGTVAASVTGFAVFDGALHAAVEFESDSPAQIWRSYGGDWTTIMSNGFGDSNTSSTGGIAEFAGYLYVGAGNAVNGAQLWRTNDGASWEQAIVPGFGDSNNQKVEMVYVFQNQLYVSVKNAVTGIEIWRSTDGSLWEQVNQDGFSDSNNSSSNWSNATAEFLGNLYVGTSNVVDGGELWRTQQPEADLSIAKTRQGTGTALAGQRITYTISITNHGPTTPVTATVVDTWTPVEAVVGVYAPDCAVDLGGGVITCTRTSLGTGSAVVPSPQVVFTASATFSGTLTNTASVSLGDGIVDIYPDDNVTDPVVVQVMTEEIPPPPPVETDLSIAKTRQGTGTVLAGQRITYTIIITNHGPTTPVTATVVDSWTPTTAVVGVEAPGCAADLVKGTITCTYAGLGLGSALVPGPYIVLTTSATFSGTLTNSASVSLGDGIIDINPANDVGDPVTVTITWIGDAIVYLPIILR